MDLFNFKINGRKGVNHVFCQILLFLAFASIEVVMIVKQSDIVQLVAAFGTYCLTAAGLYGVLTGGNANEHWATKKKEENLNPPAQQ